MTQHHLPVIVRLLDKVLFDDGCWQWTAASTASGYGRMRVGGRVGYAHVLMYEELVGPVPPTWDVDHLCHNEAAALGFCTTHPCPHQLCVRPDHLEAKPRRDNLMASVLTEVYRNATKTECKRGHPFTPETTRIREGGVRSCLICEKGQLWLLDDKGE